MDGISKMCNKISELKYALQFKRSHIIYIFKGINLFKNTKDI